MAVLLLVVGASLGGMYTNAKYTSTVYGKATASVARYVFNVSADNTYESKKTFNDLVLAQTCDVSKLVNGKIAPGTSGSFDILLDAKGSDVGIKYNVTFTEKNGNTLPTNLVLKLDGKNWEFTDGIEGTINAGTQTNVKHTISWEWKYETTGGDAQDTIDGRNAFDYEYVITAVGTQVEPA